MRLPAQLLKRDPDSHKGTFGHVCVLGGSPGLTGAVCLASGAALRIGAGLVTAAVPASLHSIFEVKLTEEMSLPLKDEAGFLCARSLDDLMPLLDKIDIMVLGCGASQNPGAQECIRQILLTVDRPTLLDADGLNAIAKEPDILLERKAKELILTPHPGEFSRLLGTDVDSVQQKRKELVKEFALRYNLCLVLKGHRTLVARGDEVFENKTGNPGMASAGMGDVLAGIIAGLWAQGVSAFDAAKCGVHLHGAAGDYAAEELTPMCMVASDILDYLPEALRDCA